MPKNKLMFLFVLVVAVGVSISAFLGVFKGMAQTQPNNNKKEIKVRNTQKEKDTSEPTVIKEGEMTEKQKKHSKIFKGYKNREKIKDLISKKGDVEIQYEMGDVLLYKNFNLNNYLQKLFCKADTIVIGKVKTKASQINNDGTFTFTDYEFTAEEVLKNNATDPINPDTDITITRTGGAVKLKGNTVRAIDHRQVPLIVGEHYLLFLRFVPETGGYTALGNARDDDSFQIIGNRLIQQVSKNLYPLGAGRKVETSEFIAQVRAAANGACINQGGLQ